MKERSNAAAVVLRWMFLAFITLISVGPLVWIVMSSFKTNQEILQSAFALRRGSAWTDMPPRFSMSPIFDITQQPAHSRPEHWRRRAGGGDGGVTSSCAFAVSRSKALMMLFPRRCWFRWRPLLMPIYIIFNQDRAVRHQGGTYDRVRGAGAAHSLFILRAHFQGVPRS